MGFLDEELQQPASAPAQPAAAPPVQGRFLDSELAGTGFLAQDAAEQLRAQPRDIGSATPRPNPLTAGVRYSNVGDMNARPRPQLIDDRVEDESWADEMASVGKGVKSAGLSFADGVVSSFASVPEAIRHAYDSVVLAAGNDEADRAYLQDIIAREKKLGMRSEIAAAIKSVSRMNPEDVVPGFWTQDLPNALGYSAAFMAGGAAGLAVKAPLWLTTAALGGTTGAVQFYDDALGKGATSEDASKAFAIGSIVGLSEAVPVFRVVDRLDKYSGGTFGRLLNGKVAKLLEGKVGGVLATGATGAAERSFTREALKEGMKGAFEESLQETFQQGMQNWTASDLVGYDPNRTLGENVASAGETGGGVGFLLSTAAAALGLKMRGTPLETEVAKRLRKFKEGGELTVENLKDILLALQINTNLDQDIAAIKAENDAKFAALDALGKDEHLDRMAHFAYTTFGSREPGKWTGGFPGENAGLKTEPLEVGGQTVNLKDFANSSEDVAVNFGSTGVLSAGEAQIRKSWGKDALNLVRAFRDAFASEQGGSGPKPKIVLSFASFSNHPPYGQAGILHVDKNTGDIVLGVPTGSNPDIVPVYRVFVDPARLESMHSPHAVVSTLFHELGHIFVNLRVKELQNQALTDLQAGMTTSPAIRATSLYNVMYERFLLKQTENSYTGQDFIKDAGDFAAYTHGIFVNPQGPANIGMASLDFTGQPKGAYWANPHEFFARVMGSYAGFPGQENIFNILGIDEKVLGPEFKGTLADLRKFYTSGAGVDTTRYPTFEAYMRSIALGKQLENSFSNPVAIDFVKKVLSGAMTPADAVAAFKGWNSHLDKYGKIIRWGTTIIQLARLNEHIPQLQKYVEVVQQWDAFRKQKEAAAIDLISQAKELGKERSSRLFKTLIEETVGGKNFDSAELAQRLPDAETLALFNKIKGHFAQLLNLMEEVVVEQTKEAFANDPSTQLQKLAQVRSAFQRMRGQPYFPLMRFGKYAVEVREKGTGKMLEYHLFENTQDQADALEELRAAFPQAAVSKRPVKDFELGAQGMPFAFTQALEAKFAKAGNPLTAEQLQQMKELSYDFLPARSFLRKFKQRKNLGGYSEDGMRSLAAYTQNAVGFIARAKYGEAMQQQVQELEHDANWINQVAPDEVKDKSKRHEIAQHMARHYKYIMEPAGEWAALRSLGFLYYMGYNVKSAIVNLTQVPFVTYPYLAARYGDPKAVAALTRANALMVKYWKDPKSLSTEEFDLLEKGRQQGWLDESLASELAVAATDGVVDRLLPIDAKGRFRAREFAKLGKHTYYKAAHWGSIPFHVIEKLNRSVTALAAHQLAVEKGASHEEAIKAARDAVQQTQYEYSRWARPEMMRGKKGALFLFKSYLQGTLFFLVNDPGAWRYLTMLAVVGGLQGLPGADDLLDLIDGLGTPVREFLGFKNPKVDIRTEMRKDAAEMLKDLEINPDVFFRGIASQSFGLSMLGEALGIPIPNVDLSGSLSMGNIIPGTDLLKKGYRTDTPQELVGQLAEDVGGPLGSVAMGAISPWVRDDPDSWRRWERALPLAARNLSKAARIAIDGDETTAGGDVIANFDINDPRDMAELAGQALGFTPRKISLGWERYMAELEVTSYWLARKAALMAKFNYANEMKDREGRADAMLALKEYNRIVPYPQMRLSAEDIRRSASTYLKRRAKLSRGLALQNDFVKLRREYAEAYGVIPEVGSPNTGGSPPAVSAPGSAE